MDNAGPHSIEDIAKDAIGMTPDRRSRFLDAACHGDPGLRAEVDAWLADQGVMIAQRESGLLETVALEAVSATDDAADGTQPTAEPALLEGEPIIAACDARRMNIPARLRLFQKVCGRVHELHRRGLIHGGLGAGRILLQKDGAPRLTGQGQPPAPEDTSPEQVIGEPITTGTDIHALGVVLFELLTGRHPYRREAGLDEIAQVICEQVPERPSLAVGHGNSPDQIAEARGVTSWRLIKSILAGDLELIVLKALQKEPERRFSSAEQLSEDIDRFFEKRPVRARQTTWPYRARLFGRRHAMALVIGLALTMGLVGLLVRANNRLDRLRIQRDQFEASSRSARDAIDTLYETIKARHQFEQPTLGGTRNDLLKPLARFYDEVADASAGATPTEDFAQVRSRVAWITRRIGTPSEAVLQDRLAVALWDELAASAQGNDHAREELAAALDALGQTIAVEPGGVEEAANVFARAQGLVELLVTADGRSFRRRGLLAQVIRDRALALRHLGRDDEALAHLQRALTIESELRGEQPGEQDVQIDLAATHAQLARTLHDRQGEQNLAPAIDHLDRAVRILEPLVRDHPDRVEAIEALAANLSDLSTLRRMAGQVEGALADSQHSLEVYAQLNQRFPGVIRLQEALAGAFNMLGDVYRQRGEPRESHEFARKALEILDRLAAEHPKDTFYPLEQARTHNVLGRLLAIERKPAEALKAFQRAIDLLEGQPSLDALANYRLAVNLALAMSLVGARPGETAPEDEAKLAPPDGRRRALYGHRAMIALRKAVDGGVSNLEMYKTDPDLDSLRSRPDFKELLKKLAETPSTPS